MEGGDSETGSAEVIREAQNWQDDSAMYEKGPAYRLRLAIVIAPAVLEAQVSSALTSNSLQRSFEMRF